MSFLLLQVVSFRKRTVVFGIAAYFLLSAVFAAPVSAAPRDDSPILGDWCLQDGKTAADVDDAYLRSAQKRRNERLKTLKATYPKIVFTKHFDIGGSHYAYTEAQSDAQAERNFVRGSALCLLELGDDGEYREKTLLSDLNGVIRDPAVTFDGKRILFAWKKSDRLDDYHLYDYDVADGRVRQLTFGNGYADYEPCPLPNGDIVFNSTRCVQVVDCWLTEVSNLYRCDRDGRFLRRLSFDQVHTNHPSLMDDGRILYTRWDYNDRGQIFPQGLFQMNADGTRQTEFYGNNSWFPTTLMHARGIPDDNGKVIAIFSGHHNRQYGKVGIVDTSQGRQENSGTRLIAPVRETKADRVDSWGQKGDRFSHPYPINGREFLISYNPGNTDLPPLGPDATEKEKRDRRDREHTLRTPFGLYWFNDRGERELLAYDAKISCNQPVPLAARRPVQMRDSLPDPSNEFGTFTMQDVYFGPGMEGVERGTARTLRVIALDFRSVGIGKNANGGPAGGAMVSTPVSISHGTWDVKIPLGDVPIHEDGSASFVVPAKTPVYFQILDENGHCIQTMRSWATLQPGETFSCIGCHEDKNIAAPPSGISMATRKGAQRLKPFYGEARGFSFAREIQPILDKHCIECHHDAQKEPPYRFAKIGAAGNKPFADFEAAKDKPILRTASPWHYTTETPAQNWMKPEYFETARRLPLSKGAFGNAPSGKPNTDWSTPDLWIWGTVELPEDWQPQPLILQCFHDEEIDLFVNGKKVFSESGHTPKYEHIYLEARETASFRGGTNFLAAHIRQTGGGQGVDLGLWSVKAGGLALPGENETSGKTLAAFSLKGDPVLDRHAKRYWSQSYLNLTNSQKPKPHEPFTGRQTPVVNWINVQEGPSMLPPYKAGATRSRLMKMLDPNLAVGGRPHRDVRLSREELDKLAAWIDLLVPYCGDYLEANAWDDKELQKFAYYEKKRADMKEMDRENVLRLVAHHQDGASATESRETAVSNNAYRNLALNPDAVDVVQDQSPKFYPAASSNSVCRGAAEFAASNGIDGKTANRGHGSNFPSWGPDRNVKDLWWKVEFGKPVHTDRVVIRIRADFPHDTYWKECTIECSNGFKKRINLKKTAEPQEFLFPPQRIEWLKLCEFVPETDGWAALSEVEVYGIDAVSREYVAPGTEGL
ncbi:MAG TPA: hypothetical protein DEB39_01355 [Planctomycetaceae bacterium]|nr:hypothetical protein [Planctomycetaceae bacterium]